ncbi:hypothetical protein [Bradyrhizobium sp. 6(2017)]|uniref:hypothetical protein n=1 Tax=Bradyrhizobium sp. 6(2017) TaxID=1197460 RepID=UPI0013E18B84|nr:hypothetical protein [Bradyrhizobium sp. 6(2017)]QIG96411.1 hypothetical protein G6P99_31080 [Bradyrhizobium sp. 6(2017)]
MHAGFGPAAEVMAAPKRLLQKEELVRRSRLCEDVNGLAASIAKEEFNGTGAGVSYLFDRERHNFAQDDPAMKLTTIGLAMALTLPSKFALAEGTLNYSLPVVRPVVRGVAVLGHGRSRPRISSPGIRSRLMRDPRGVTLAPSTIGRSG